MNKPHTFHIPVMGTGFTIDTPLKVSQFGIDSVMSIGDDIILEKLRKKFSTDNNLPYEEITDKTDDYRAKRITAYLNLVSKLAVKNFNDLKDAVLAKENSPKRYFNMLPENSKIRKEFKELVAKIPSLSEIGGAIKNNLSMGSIDVNIMTKLDKVNYSNNEKLPTEFNDAHAALRGYANSDLESSVVFSAGMNPRLYSYISQFEDFFPNENGEIKKKIVLKVSDYRSALIQGKFLAKKGLWVSEYRIESGLNCGGHAFATEGYLLGPILDEFKEKREELVDSVRDIFVKALTDNNKTIPKATLDLKITAQGGVGTAEEHDFLTDHYKIDSVGWGSPFLLVPEAISIDNKTLNQLADAEENDLYLSHISPLGVRFNNLRNNSKDIEKLERAKNGKPGSPCIKKYLALNTELTEKSICTASRQYQNLKIKELDKQEISPDEYQDKYKNIIDKACICTGLATPALLANDIPAKVEGDAVSVCPGPNMAYFSKIMSLKQITDHIYGRANVISRTDRPNMFIKELNIYIDFLKEKIEETRVSATNKQRKYLLNFEENLNTGINYYQKLYGNLTDKFQEAKAKILTDLEESKKALQLLNLEIDKIVVA